MLLRQRCTARQRDLSTTATDSVGFLWAWAEHSQLSQAYNSVRRTASLMFGDLPLPSYTGFIRALVACTERLLPVLRGHLQRLMVAGGGELVRIGGFFVLVARALAAVPLPIPMI